MKVLPYVAVSDSRSYRKGPHGFAEVFHKIDKVWCYSCVTNDELLDHHKYHHGRVGGMKTASFISQPTIKGNTQAILYRKGAGEMAEFFEEDGKYWRTSPFVTNHGLSRWSENRFLNKI